MRKKIKSKSTTKKSTMDKVDVDKRTKRRALTEIQAERLKKMYTSGKHRVADISEKFGISIATMYNYVKGK